MYRPKELIICIFIPLWNDKNNFIFADYVSNQRPIIFSMFEHRIKFNRWYGTLVQLWFFPFFFYKIYLYDQLCGNFVHTFSHYWWDHKEITHWIVEDIDQNKIKDALSWLSILLVINHFDTQRVLLKANILEWKKDTIKSSQEKKALYSHYF